MCMFQYPFFVYTNGSPEIEYPIYFDQFGLVLWWDMRKGPKSWLEISRKSFGVPCINVHVWVRESLEFHTSICMSG